ncbi:MFS general substrate transporter [Vararia minispora EC-137]|uniref:MFS general substrate transporter n=1 Tax=Vararia minispora EC-137 TaxID=1314806 RepID=A0ACB8QTJ7_9AGAM|nr:MFS general substrate transporter [Vararia minispora EC-137]
MGSKSGSTEALELPTLPGAAPSDFVAEEHSRLESLNFASPEDEESGESVSNLPPVDGGFGSWSYARLTRCSSLASAFLVEMLVWGFPSAFGSFLEAYLREDDIVSQPHATSLLPLIGTLSTGIMYCSGPISYPLSSRFRQYRRPAMWLGMTISWASLFGASFTRKVTNLLLLQGVLYSLGGVILYPAAISYMSEWFIAKRGLALGVIDGGTAAGGLIIPLFLPKLISTYGSSLTLRYFSFGYLIGTMIVLPFIRPRLSERGTVIRPSQRVSNNAWARSPHWWLILLVNMIQGFAWFVPVIWLPTYTAELGVSSSTASLSLAFLNGASFISRLSFGTLSDYFSPWPLACAVLSSASVVTFLLWGVAGHALAGTIIFALAFGGLTGGWTSMWSAFTKPIAKDDISLYVSLFGHLMFTRGLGNVLSTPISNGLSSAQGSNNSGLYKRATGFEVAGGRFGSMIVFTGSCLAAGAAISFFAWWRERAGRQ